MTTIAIYLAEASAGAGQAAGSSACWQQFLVPFILGVVVTWLTTYPLKVKEWKQAHLTRAIAVREELYSEFITEAAVITLMALEGPLDDAQRFARMYSILSRCQLVDGEEQVVQIAQEYVACLCGYCVVPKDDAAKRKTVQDELGDKKKTFLKASKAKLDDLKKRARY